MESATRSPDLHPLRVELRRQLALQGKNSLYSVIGVPADSSDADIAGAIARLATDTTPPPEVRYAVETLGNPASREQFDRRLLEQLRTPVAPAPMPAPPQEHGGGAIKMMAAVVLILGVGYLGLGYFKEKSEREIRLKEAELRKEAIHKAAEIADRVVDNQKTSIDVSAAAQERAAEARERAQLEARMREDKYRLDQAYRQEQQTAASEQRRQQSEQYRAQAEARRKEMEAAALTRSMRQEAIADAIARGNYNEAQRLRNQN